MRRPLFGGTDNRAFKQTISKQMKKGIAIAISQRPFSLLVLLEHHCLSSEVQFSTTMNLVGDAGAFADCATGKMNFLPSELASQLT
jgi:hypothetical protein